ncbi:MAG: Holliday junction resolvase Hjc [Nanoarchaeota archaeon]
MSKNKGSRTERELLHMLYKSGFAVVRSTGSGLSSYPNPDLIASNGKKYLAIECKSLKNNVKYLTKDDVKQLLDFSKRFKSEPWFGLRFNNEGWYFLKPKDLKKGKGKNFSISIDYIKKKGLTFKKLIR